MSTSIFIAWFMVGILAGLGFLLYASKGNRDSEKQIYLSGLILAALIYILFALIWGTMPWVALETLGVLLFGVLAYLGRRWSFYLIAFGWLLHSLWDFGLHLYGPGVEVAPTWYAIACASFDLVVAGVIAYKVYTWRPPELV